MTNKQYFVIISSQEIVFRGIILFEQHNSYIILTDNNNLEIPEKLIYYLKYQIKRFCIQNSERNPHKIMEYAKKEIERYQKTINNINVNQYKNQLMFISMDNFITLRLLSEDEFIRFRQVDKIIKEIII